MNNKVNSTVKDMTTGNIWKQLIVFMIPLLVGNIFQQFYNTIDSVVVGNYVGKDALAAVTSTSPISIMLVGFFMGMSTGAGVVVSQYFGAKDTKSLRRSVHTAIMLTIILGILFMIIGYLITPVMLRFMDTPNSVMNDADKYLKTYFLGILGLMLYNMASGILRAVGDSKTPLYVLIFSSVMNIILDLLFVIVFKLGVFGVALATIIAQFLSSFVVLFILFRSKDVYSLRIRELCIDFDILKKIVKIGFPAGIQTAIVSFSNVFVQSYINHFGADAAAAWGVYTRIDAFAILPLQSMGLSITTYVGQNAGANKKKRINDGIKIALVIAVVITTIICAPLVIFAPTIASLFNKEALVIAYATTFIRVNEFFDIVACTNQIHAGALRGVGNAIVPSIVMIFSFVVFRQIYLKIVSMLTSSIIPIAWGYPAGWICCSIILFIYFKRHKIA
ncbi:MATE family efflux transporter [Lachnospira multipara]|uniref:MATE family efflux transporter n=1 Tax=Lachnospira multipara TaxID=28051 RepID=UPI0004805897|nr:MATE family efflux transporter [Lachnospira multipara]